MRDRANPRLRLSLSILVFVLQFFVALADAAGSIRIRWQVDNPFRLFVDGAATSLHAEALKSLALEEAQTPILSSERKLAEVHAEGWAAAQVGYACWNQAKLRYECKEIASYVHPTSHRVRLRVEGVAAHLECVWRIENLVRGRELRQACGGELIVDVPYPAGATFAVEQSTISASEIVKVEDLFVLSLGDSYASGDGNPDRAVRLSTNRAVRYGPEQAIGLAGYPTRDGRWQTFEDRNFVAAGPVWLDPSCQRSLYSYPARVALMLALEDPHRAITFASFACWGTDVVKGLFLPYPRSPLAPDMPALAQLSAAALAQCGLDRARRKVYATAFNPGGRLPELNDVPLLNCPASQARKIDLLLLSVGGNDIGFAQLIANAVLADASVLRNVGGWLGQLRSPQEALNALEEIQVRYRMPNRALHNVLHVPWQESNRIVLTAYPTLALREDGESACPSGRAGLSVLPDLALSEQRTHTAELVGAKLNAAMADSARSNGWTFVDSHRALFAGHGLCAGAYGGIVDASDDMRLPRLTKDGWRPFSPESWRPYASRKRWIRTPNDGFLTVHYHGRNGSPSPLQLLIASTYSGAFHPTAEGQAVMADAVLIAARSVLDRYQSPRSGSGR